MKQQLFHDLKETIAFLGKKKYSYLGSMISYSIIESICYNIVLAIVMKLVLEAVEYQESKLFWEGCFIAVSSFLIAFLFGSVLLRVKAKSVRTTIARIRIELVDRITAMSVNCFETRESGDLLTRTTQILDGWRDVIMSHSKYYKK